MDAQSESTTGKQPKAKNKIFWLIAFVVTFVAIKEITQLWFNERSVEKAGVTANRNFDKMREKVAAEHPEKPLAYAMREEALKQVANGLAQKSGDKKAYVASDQFVGFYMVNVRTRDDYCKALGVDITPFTSVFKAEHKELYEKSRVIHARGPYTPDKLESMVYQQLLPALQKTIKDDMEGIAKQYNISTKETCGVFNTSGADIAKKMHLSKVSPPMYQALMEAR